MLTFGLPDIDAVRRLHDAFLAMLEAGTPLAHRHALLAARDSDTVVTCAFSGRPARRLANTFERSIDAAPERILPALYNAATSSRNSRRSVDRRFNGPLLVR